MKMETADSVNTVNVHLRLSLFSFWYSRCTPLPSDTRIASDLNS